MKVFLECFWATPKRDPNKFFSFKDCWNLVEEYAGRIEERGFVTRVVAGQKERRTRSQLWLCHPRGKQLSSLEISQALQRTMASGLDLTVAIGADMGFSGDEIKILKPELLWSFGPLTLPHELAAVVAMEQLYRGLSILRHEPYHRE